MTKTELIARLNELEAQQQPKLPAHVAAHEAGAKINAGAKAAGKATRQGIITGAAVVTGFFSGLLGK